MDNEIKRQGVASEVFDAGYTDLVSVTPPDARICPTSRIRGASLGKCPGLKRGECWSGYNFLAATPTREEVEKWDAWGGNLGLRADHFPALDIDVDEEVPAKVVEDFLLDRLGPAPCRLSQFSRRLLAYRTASPFGRRRLSFHYEGVACAVEVLCTGRQYVIHGEHPSGERYRWRDVPLWDQTPDSLTEVTEAQIDHVLEELSEKLAETSGVTDLQLKIDGRGGEPGTSPPQQHLKAPSYEELEEVVRAIPNDARFESREDYIRVGYAIKAAGGEQALPIFLDWCERWEDGHNDPETVEADWISMSPPFRIGWPYLVHISQLRWAHLALEVEPWTAPEEGDETEGSESLREALQVASQLTCEWASLPRRLTEFATTISDLSIGEAAVAEAAAVHTLTQAEIRTSSEARRLLDRYSRRNMNGAFEEDDYGVPVLRLLTAADATVEGRFLVDELIPAAGVGALYADFGVGKTMLTIDLGLSIAFGRPWFGRETVERPVIFLVAEGNREFPVRVFAWLVEHGLMERKATKEELFKVLEGRVLINRYPARFDDPHFAQGLRETIERSGAGMVFVDTLGKSLGPEQPEKDNDVANEILGMLSDIAARTDCGTLLIHHVGYGATGRARGASAWEQGVNYSYRIDGTRAQFRSGEALRLRCQKMKDAPEPSPRSFRLKTIPGLALRRYGSDDEVRIAGAAVVPAVETSVPVSLEARVFKYIQDHTGCSKGDVRTVTGGSSDVDGALASLLSKGAVKNAGVPNRHRYETIPMWDIGPGGNVVNLAKENPFGVEPASEAS